MSNYTQIDVEQLKQYVLKQPLKDEDKQKFLASIEQSAAGQSIFNMINAQVRDALSKLSPEELREKAESVLLAVLSVGTITSLADVGTDFLDFGVGQAFSTAIHPLVSRLISMPVDDILKKVFRYRAPSPRILLGMIDSGVVDENLLRKALIDSDLKDEYIEAILAFSRVKTADARAKSLEKVREESLKVAVLPQQLVVSRAETLLNRLETEVSNLEIELAVLPLKNQVAQMERVVNSLEKALDAYDNATTDKQANAALTKVYTYLNRSNALLKQAS